jgi:hypothetical protein
MGKTLWPARSVSDLLRLLEYGPRRRELQALKKGIYSLYISLRAVQVLSNARSCTVRRSD